MKVIAVNYSTGFLWDFGKVVLYLQDPSLQPLLVPSPWDSFKDPWAGGNSDVGPSHAAQL